MPERLATAALDHLKKCLSHTQAEIKSLPGLMIGGVLSEHPEPNSCSLNHYFIEYLLCARHCFVLVFETLIFLFTHDFFHMYRVCMHICIFGETFEFYSQQISII